MRFRFQQKSLICTSWLRAEGRGKQYWQESCSWLRKVHQVRYGKTQSGNPMPTLKGALAVNYQRILIYLESKPTISCTCECINIKTLTFVRHSRISIQLTPILVSSQPHTLQWFGRKGIKFAVRLESKPH